MGPKAPHYVIKDEIPNLLDNLLDEFLPQGLGLEQKNSEKEIIEKFIVDFNQIRKYHLQSDFTNSQVFHNISVLYSTFSFVSIIETRNWMDVHLNFISFSVKLVRFNIKIMVWSNCCTKL